MITVVCACGCVCVSYEYDESIQARKIIDSDPGQIYRSSNFLLNGNWTELGTPEDSMKLGPNTLVQTQLPTKNTQTLKHTHTHTHAHTHAHTHGVTVRQSKRERGRDTERDGIDKQAY